MRLSKDGHTLTRPFLVAIVAVALALPACGKKKGDEAAASSSKGSTPAGSGGTTKAPPKPPGPAPTDPAPTDPAPTDPAPTAAPAPAPPAEYFKIKAAHADASKGPFELQLGTWSVVKASFDPANLEGATAELEIDLASLSSGVEWRDAQFRSPDYFDVAKFPKATVSVDNVKMIGEARYTADAEVNVHGTEKKMSITMDVLASAADRVTVKVTQPMSRLAFGIGSTVEMKNPYAVEVVVEAVVTLKKP